MPPQLPVVVGLKREAYQVIYYIWTISAIYLFIAPELCCNFQFSKTQISKLKLVQMGNCRHGPARPPCLVRHAVPLHHQSPWHSWNLAVGKPQRFDASHPSLPICPCALSNSPANPRSVYYLHRMDVSTGLASGVPKFGLLTELSF